MIRNMAAGVRWSAQISAPSDPHEPQVVLSATSEGQEGVEEAEARAWYFVAPDELLGNWVEAYGGEQGHAQIQTVVCRRVSACCGVVWCGERSKPVAHSSRDVGGTAHAPQFPWRRARLYQ